MQFERNLRTKIADRLNKSISGKFVKRDIGGKSTLAYEIEEGNDKPYMDTLRNLLLIRTGSNDRRPNEEELMNLMSEKKN